MNISQDDLQMLIQAIIKRSMFKTKSDIEFIQNKLKDVPFFRNMNKQIGDAQYYKIIKELQYECHQPYQPEVRIGDQSTKFYFILQGTFLILTRNFLTSLQLPNDIQQILDQEFPDLIPQGYLYPGQYFGEQVMMFDQSHTQTVLPLDKCHVIVIKRDTYRRVIDQETRKQESERFAILSTVPLLRSWSAKTIRVLSTELQELNFMPNQIIYFQGDPVDAVYIIVDGEVQLFRSYNKNSLPISILGCKESFGDDEILTQFRSHSARSLTSVRLFRILKNKFLDHIPFDYSSKYFKKETNHKLSLYYNDDQFRIYRSESLKLINSPANVMQKLMRRNKDKNKTYQSISYQQVTDLMKSNIRQGVSKSNSVHEHLRIHANGKFDKTTYLLNQIKLRSTSVWKKK